MSELGVFAVDRGVFDHPLLSTGGIVIIDDWHLAGCRLAVDTYRSRHAIEDKIVTHDGNAYWVKQQDYGFPDLP